MKKNEILEIEAVLKLHSNYSDNFSVAYLAKMDRLALNYPGNTLSRRLCNMLDVYFESVGVETLKEAHKRLKEMESNI